MRKHVFGVSDRSDTNRAVQSQKTWLSRGLKFRNPEEEQLYNLYGENNGANQLRDYLAADLHLCYHKCIKQVF